MKDETQNLLDKLKEAGYEKVSIFTADKRVPDSMGHTEGQWKGLGTDREPYRLISATPHLTEEPDGKGVPKIWGIMHELWPDADNNFGGGQGDCHTIPKRAWGVLDAGYYEL